MPENILGLESWNQKDDLLKNMVSVRAAIVTLELGSHHAHALAEVPYVLEKALRKC